MSLRSTIAHSIWHFAESMAAEIHDPNWPLTKELLKKQAAEERRQRGLAASGPVPDEEFDCLAFANNYPRYFEAARAQLSRDPQSSIHSIIDILGYTSAQAEELKVWIQETEPPRLEPTYPTPPVTCYVPSGHGRENILTCGPDPVSALNAVRLGL